MVMVECDGDEREIKCGDVGIARNPEHKRERWREAWMRSRLSSAERQVRRTGTRGMDVPLVLILGTVSAPFDLRLCMYKPRRENFYVEKKRNHTRWLMR